MEKSNLIVLILMFLCGISFTQNYYEVIGINPSATTEEISAKCRQEIAKEHPEKKNHTDDAHAKFQEINHACEVLKNNEKRSQYDDTLAGGKLSSSHGRVSTLAIEGPVSKQKKSQQQAKTTEELVETTD
jgi:DnaJ-class molecular chaperone